MTIWALLALILWAWPYRLVLYGLLILAMWARRTTHSAPIIAIKPFAFALTSGQLLAIAASILFACSTLHWQLRPQPILLESWVSASWHFYVDALFSELGLGLVAIFLWKTSRVSLYSIGFRQYSGSYIKLLLIIALVVLTLHFVVRPGSLKVLDWLREGFNADGSYSGSVGVLQWEVLTLRQSINLFGAYAIALSLLWIGIVEPFIEEVFFRGLLLTALIDRGYTRWALVVQALFYSALHLDLQRALYLFVFGLILGCLVKRTSSLLPALILHVVVNLFSLIPSIV